MVGQLDQERAELCSIDPNARLVILSTAEMCKT